MSQKPKWITPEEWQPEDLWSPHTPAYTGTCTDMQMYTRIVIFKHTSWIHGAKLWMTFQERREGQKQIALKALHCTAEKQDSKAR